MSDVVVYRVEKPTDADIEIATEILSIAFSKDVFHMITVGHDQALGREKILSMVRTVVLTGELYFARIGEKVVGAAGWFGPGRAAYDTEEARKEAMGPFVAAMTPELRTWNNEVFRPGYARLTDACFGEGYKLASYHLQTIGVLPDYRGKSLSRRLIEHVKDNVAFPQGKNMCLEAVTAKNADIYEHIGFKRAGEPGTFKGAPSIGGEFTFHCMTWDCPSPKL